MFDYIVGIVKDIESSYIVIDNNNIGYRVFASNPYSFKIDEEYKIYLYNHVKEDENSLYGFKTKDERDLFLKLINVKGLGPKMALPMLSVNDVNNIINAIELGNVEYLKKFPKIGDKVARQIVLDLKSKLIVDNKKIVNEELIEALKALGYKSSDISKISDKIDSNLSIEEQIKEALKLLLK